MTESTGTDLVLARISSESVREATGRGWDEWLEALDVAGAVDWKHKTIVAYLAREHAGETTSWWRQSITVAYEQARGKRAVGETADTGFQVGVQRTVEATPAEAWELIRTRPDIWLGAKTSLDLIEGERYQVPGASGEIRVVKPGDRLHMTWRPTGWAEPATLQLTLSESASGKTAIHAHLEKLPDADSREALRTHWRQVLGRIAQAAN